MERKTSPKVVLNYQEYKLLLKKAELYDQYLNEKKPPQDGGSIAQIVANQAFNDGLLKPDSSKVLVEDVSPVESNNLVHKSNVLFNQFEENHLLEGLKNFQKKKALAIINEIKKQPDQLTFDNNGTVYIEGNSIPDSNFKDFLIALSSGKSKPVGFKDFVIKLQQMGLSRYIPKKSLPIKEFDPKEIIDKNPFSMEKWYFIGQ